MMVWTVEGEEKPSPAPRRETLLDRKEEEREEKPGRKKTVLLKRKLYDNDNTSQKEKADNEQVGRGPGQVSQ